ncbi:MAG: glycerophosphodiester phosphodiesterase family protein [Acidimicrobiia bacterium]|nr:glycerophosphodiester phosphodiesterase family protein [Acidimicrobiia bacterium]
MKLIQQSSRKQATRFLWSLGLSGVLALTGCQGAIDDTREAIPVSEDFDVQGHRGARGLKPENTLPAFEVALDLGVTTLELDLHYTADGHVVVWHDPVIEPDKCGLDDGAPESAPDPDDPGTRRARAIAALRLDQLKWFRCDRNPDPGGQPDQESSTTALAGDDFGIVTLAGLFEFVEAYSTSEEKTDGQRANATRVRFNVETKRQPDDPGAIGDEFNGIEAGAFELALLDLVDRFQLKDRIIVQSFDHRSLWVIHALDSSIRLAALTSSSPGDLEVLAAKGASIWSPRASILTEQQITDAHNAGLEVVPWTVNSPIEMARLISLGVDGIITDRPDLLLDQLGQR